MASQDQHGTLIVTGASRGIGAAIAKLAGERGFFVTVNFVNGRGEAAAVVHEIASAGGRARAIQGDVANEEDVVRLFETAERELGPIKALVNNAAITGGVGRGGAGSAAPPPPGGGGTRPGPLLFPPRAGLPNAPNHSGAHTAIRESLSPA